ncbi:MAG: LysR family transcriptional regulator [Verrucomicrobiota bacterium]
MPKRYGCGMELRHLRYFVVVAEELNLTHASARLRVAQPALSRQIKDLEEELQTRLFDRRRTGVQLTPAGGAFLRRARVVLEQAALAAQEARAAAGLVTGTLSIGYPSGLHLNYLEPVLRQFRGEHPRVELDYLHIRPGEQLKALRDGQIDIAFLNLPERPEGLEHAVVWRVPYEVVMPAHHPLARRASFKLSDLRGEDFVFSTRDARPEFYDGFFHQCANAGFHPRIVKEVGGYPTNILGLISVGVGVSVLPHFKETERFASLVWRPLNEPRLFMDWSLVSRREKTAATARFLGMALKKYPVAQDMEATGF